MKRTWVNVPGGLLALALGGCAPAPSPERITETITLEMSAVLSQYQGLLEKCHRAGRTSGSYEDFATCARNVDEELYQLRRARTASNR